MEKKQRMCMKCKRPLPEGYRHIFCESCRTKQAEDVKKVTKKVMGVTAAVASIAVVIGTAGKINPKD